MRGNPFFILAGALAAMPAPAAMAQNADAAGAEPPVWPPAGAEALAAAVSQEVPLPVAIQLLDRTASALHHGFLAGLESAGAYPPRGADAVIHRALCTFHDKARALRIESRQDRPNDAVLRAHAAAVRAAAVQLDRIASRGSLPLEIDTSLQDALDLAVVIDEVLRGGN